MQPLVTRESPEGRAFAGATPAPRLGESRLVAGDLGPFLFPPR